MFGFWLFLFKYVWILGIILIILTASYSTYKELTEEYKKQLDYLKQVLDLTSKSEHLWKQSLIEKSAGYPTLLTAIQEYQTLIDNKTSQSLADKKHPAYKASEVVKNESQRRRAAELVAKQTQAIIEYYESIAPFLIDLKNDVVDANDTELYREYSEEEQLDPARQYLTKEEFRKLPTAIRNQMALDRYWKRPKSKWLIGRMYERFVGYVYEQQGFDVEYVGIFKGFEDLGRDLICQKGNNFIVIQCKNWSKFKTIYEKHIFQFFGTVFQYRDANPSRNVTAVFYTSTQLSDLARRFSKELHIDLQENFKFDPNYPCIKCNISKV
ncbi:MAG: restriction endonuclease, partial [Patescibacteria group bacterium]